MILALTGFPERSSIETVPDASANPDLFIAQAAAGSIILWSLILFGLIVGAFWVVVVVKRRVFDDQDVVGGEGFGLGELRQLHRAGQLSDEEFEKAKATIVTAGKAVAARQPEVLSPEKKAAAAEARRKLGEKGDQVR